MIWLYLDPGSGSILIQLLIAAFAGLAIFIGTSRRRIKRIFSRNKTQPNESDDSEDD